MNNNAITTRYIITRHILYNVCTLVIVRLIQFEGTASLHNSIAKCERTFY